MPNAVALNSASFNLARLAGPGIAGLVIALVGTGPAFLINAASFAAVIISLWRMQARDHLVVARDLAIVQQGNRASFSRGIQGQLSGGSDA